MRVHTGFIIKEGKYEGKVVVDLNHPVWDAPGCRGRLSRDGVYCATGKLLVAIGMEHALHDPDGDAYSPLEDLLGEDKTWEIIAINDRLNNPTQESHELAIKTMLEHLRKLPNVEIKEKEEEMLNTPVRIANVRSKSLGDVIKERREELGLTLSQVSKMSGVGKTTIHDLENGKSNSKFSTLAKVVQALS
jgi:DNA-binding XRE family transcriptional regulator